MPDMSKYKRRFQKACKQLNDLVNDMQDDGIDAQLYLANDSLNLMDGPSHDDSRAQSARYDSVIEQCTLTMASGGDW